jgi:hypothetical protein
MILWTIQLQTNTAAPLMSVKYLYLVIFFNTLMLFLFYSYRKFDIVAIYYNYLSSVNPFRAALYEFSLKIVKCFVSFSLKLQKMCLSIEDKIFFPFCKLMKFLTI